MLQGEWEKDAKNGRAIRYYQQDTSNGDVYELNITVVTTGFAKEYGPINFFEGVYKDDIWFFGQLEFMDQRRLYVRNGRPVPWLGFSILRKCILCTIVP